MGILERILLALGPVTLAQSYRAELQGGLTHPNDTVKILALTQVGCRHTARKYIVLLLNCSPCKQTCMFYSQIGRMVEHPEASTEILNNHDILAATICCIGEEKMDVAKQVRTQAKKYVAWVFQ